MFSLDISEIEGKVFKILDCETYIDKFVNASNNRDKHDSDELST